MTVPLMIWNDRSIQFDLEKLKKSLGSTGKVGCCAHGVTSFLLNYTARWALHGPTAAGAVTAAAAWPGPSLIAGPQADS
eukprot:382271-Rhodomonas_salina.1